MANSHRSESRERLLGLLRLTEAARVPDEVHRDLYELLETDPEARADYTAYMQMVWSLQWDGVPYGEHEAAVPSREFRAIRPVQRYLFRRRAQIAAIIGTTSLALVIFAVAIVLAIPASPPAMLAAIVDGAALQPVFEGRQAPAVESGQPLNSGGYELAEGIVRIDFSSGAQVVVEGPASFIISESKVMFVDRGLFSIRARPGFTVQTRAGPIVDLGTAFTVQAEAEDVVTQVVEGAVQVGQFDESGRREFQVLHVGDAARATATSEWTSADFDVSDFLPPEAVAKIAAGSDDPYHRWLAQSRKLRCDEDVLLYLTFGDVRFGDDEVRDQSPSAQPSGHVYGARPVTGRFPETVALSFRGPEYADVVSFDEPLSQMLHLREPRTIAMWFRMAAHERHGTVIAGRRFPTSNNVAERPLDEFVHGENASWAFTITGRPENQRSDEPLGLVAFSQAENEWLHHDRWQTRSMTPATIGKWVHAVAVTVPREDDPKRCTTKLYVNGRLEAERVDSLAIGGVAPFQIGGLIDFEGLPIMSDQNFEGAVDEFIVFNRELAGEEIAELYEESKPRY